MAMLFMTRIIQTSPDYQGFWKGPVTGQKYCSFYIKMHFFLPFAVRIYRTKSLTVQP